MKKFWEEKNLNQMSQHEWESLCDMCGKCCLVKLQDQDSEDVFYTSIACSLFDKNSCKCKDYKNRQKRITDCIQLTPKNVTSISWLPKTCSYVLIANKKSLPNWHHLVKGNTKDMHRLKKSVKSLVESPEGNVELENHILNNKEIDT